MYVARRGWTCTRATLHRFKNISHEPIGYNTKIGIDRVEQGRLDIWMVATLHKLQGGVSFIAKTHILLIRKA